MLNAFQITHHSDADLIGSIWMTDSEDDAHTRCIASSTARYAADQVIDTLDLGLAYESRDVAIEFPPRIEGGQHLNANILNREDLQAAIDDPSQNPQLTIRVSGYAVFWNSLTKEQQQDVITRTFTTKI